MKHGQKTKAELGKTSNFLRSLKRPGLKKEFIRRGMRGNTFMPNSSKIGAGEVTARRNLSMFTLHKKNHRSNEMVGI